MSVSAQMDVLYVQRTTACLQDDRTLSGYKGCTWVIVGRFCSGTVCAAQIVKRKLSSPWGFLPRGYFSLHAVFIPHTSRSARQKNSYFGSQTLSDTHIIMTTFVFLCQTWVIEATHYFFIPPTRVCVQLHGAVDQTFFLFLSLCLCAN